MCLPQALDVARGDLRIAPDIVLLTEICLFHTVNLGEFDVFLLESGGCFLIMRCEILAVSAPGNTLRL
jgi:hypothetical protein